MTMATFLAYVEPVPGRLYTADAEVSGIRVPPNIRVERFVPHTPVLARTICTVCHAGMGITRDQPEVARRVEVSGAGVRLSAAKLDPTRLRAAVHTAIGRRPGAERIAAAFAAAGGPTAATAALEQLAGEGLRDRILSHDSAGTSTDLVEGGPP